MSLPGRKPSALGATGPVEENNGGVTAKTLANLSLPQEPVNDLRGVS
jgi:hypothetical protein